MSDLPELQSSTAAKSQRMARRAAAIKRIAPVFLIFFWSLTIIGGVVLLIVGLAGRQEEERLAAAPVCASGQVAGCRLHEQVIVVDLNTYYPARGPTTRFVKVQTPDGGTQNIEDHDGDLFPTLFATEELNAELWNGSVIRLEDDAGHYLIADDSPVVTGSVLPFTGAFFIVAGGILLAITVRELLRQRRAGQR